jgi:hypothetical protein
VAEARSCTRGPRERHRTTSLVVKGHRRAEVTESVDGLVWETDFFVSRFS